MRTLAKSILGRTPLYDPLRLWVHRRRDATQLALWLAAGRPVPPPHARKQVVLREHARRYGIRVLVETGTCYGEMVEALMGDFDRIFSIELSRELHELTLAKFRKARHVELIHGDSAVELGRLMPRIQAPALFWLDGHYSAGKTARGAKDTPIHEELACILDAPDVGHVIVIDDARCFGSDPGYPSIAEVEGFIRSRRSGLAIEVEDDSIRVTPARGTVPPSPGARVGSR